MRLCSDRILQEASRGTPFRTHSRRSLLHWQAAASWSVLQSRLVAACLGGQTVLYSLLLDTVTGFDNWLFEAGGPYFSQDAV